MSQQINLTNIIISDYGSFSGCDESRCVSKGRSDLLNNSFTCYGDDGIFYPMMCAGGFLPRIIEGQDVSPDGFVDGSEDVALHYFTCCPPDNLLIFSKEEEKAAVTTTTTPSTSVAIANATTPTTRRCSDPITASEEADGIHSSICDNHDNRRFLHRMEPTVKRKFSMIGTVDAIQATESFLCCDFPPADDEVGNEIQYLSDSECVPYRDEFYRPAKVENKIGAIAKIVCDCPEDTFVVPRPIDEGTYEDVVLTGYYQCCKSGTALPPYAEDTAFTIQVYSHIVLFGIAALVSVIVAVGLLIPLLIQLKNGTFQRAMARPRSSRRRWSRRHPREPCYSTYNLYLVFLAVPDLMYCLYIVALHIRMICQQHPLPALFWAYTFSYMNANLWINAIVCNQVLLLLQSSRRGLKMDQPTIARVSLHCGVVYFFSAITFVMTFFLWKAANNVATDGDAKTSMILGLVPILWFFFAIFGAPIAYVIYVTFVVWCRKFLPSLYYASAKERAMRGLALYFFRIVGVFIGVWIPSIALRVYGDMTGSEWAIFLQGFTAAIQPIATTCVVLTKNDTRKYILRLVTLSYIFNNKNQSIEDGYGSTHQFTAGSTDFYNSSKATKNSTNAEESLKGFVMEQQGSSPDACAKLCNKLCASSGDSIDDFAAFIEDGDSDANDEGVNNNDAGSDPECLPNLNMNENNNASADCIDPEKKDEFNTSKSNEGQANTTISGDEVVTIETP